VPAEFFARLRVLARRNRILSVEATALGAGTLADRFWLCDSFAYPGAILALFGGTISVSRRGLHSTPCGQVG